MAVRIAIFLLLLFSTFVASCAPTPTEPVLADSFFSGRALLDSNGNSQIDASDTPVANATFIVTLKGGGEFGDQTDEMGQAFITVPGGVEYPVSVRMEAPRDNPLKLIGPPMVTLSDATDTVKFLFSSK